MKKNPTCKKPCLWELFLVFFRIGLLTFGGGIAMTAVIRHELVSQNWLTEEEFVDSLSVATTIPGAIAVNIAIYAGQRINGFAGAAAALSGVVLPSFLVILSISFFFMRYFKNHVVELFFKGAGAAVVGVIAFALIEMGKTILKSRIHIFMAATGVILVLCFGFNPLWMILASAVAGYYLCAEVNDDVKDS